MATGRTLSARLSLSPSSPKKSRDECGLYNNTKTHKPLHAEFASLQKRLKSFKIWPVALQPRPETLAKAGFFYTGLGDRCVCFQCGAGLKDWSKSDDPMVEHKKFFPLCTFVIQNIGQEFINSCTAAPAQNPSTGSSSIHSTPPDTVVALPASLEPVAESLSVPTVTTSSLAVASCSRTETTTESPSSTEKSDKEAKLLELCTKDKNEEALTCKICYQKEMGVAFLPCGHVVACAKCAPSFQQCAVCRKMVTATVRVYLA